MPEKDETTIPAIPKIKNKFFLTIFIIFLTFFLFSHHRNLIFVFFKIKRKWSIL
ncbi:hypothetical protein mhp566 [Mesomycoplasma hyopneumoniae 232]|uniref:Uncharacterized protein n=1 Tax=Mesomycoplasma hyopneumoniae (strain 232) TaxID=295358 RepID=Q5ZZZ1_MESH2|nr:hypothetical protein mhp566 [Mesomycoplasma hyopneumoniae 232]